MAVAQANPDDPDRVPLLRQTPPFAELSDVALVALAALLQQETHSPDTEVVRQGDDIDTLYIVAEGRTEIASQTPSGPLILATQEPGEIFGELALLSLTRRHVARSTVTALESL